MPGQPFSIAIPEATLADLEIRLANIRWPDSVEGSGWDRGADLDFMRELVRYWRSEFDWREQESRLNALPHSMVEVGEFGIHCIHVPGRGPDPFPLVLTHGWPGSFTEMLKVLPLLTDPERHGADPADAFSVVIPSLPGFGFSDRPVTAGMNLFRVAELWVALMQSLGYERFGAQGGDFGASVSTLLGLRHGEHLAGIHLNYIPGSYRPDLSRGTSISVEEQRGLDAADAWYTAEGAYAHVQRTRPQSLAFGIHDSPVGLAAWVVEMFRNWSDCGGDVLKRFSFDELLTNVMIYWATETFHSSCRIYYENRLAPLHFAPGERVEVATAIARFPLEAPFPPRSWVERGYRVTRWTEFPRGGHFAAMEEPELLAHDIQEFFRPLR